MVPVDKVPEMYPTKLNEVTHTYCNIHPRNTVNQFCIDCDLAACDMCLLRKHRHHNLVDLAEQAPTSRKELESILEEIDVVITLVDDQIADRGKHAKQSSDDIHNTKQHIHKVIDEMITKLNKLRKQLNKSSDRIENGKEKVVMSVRDGQELKKAVVSSLRAYTDNVLRHGRDCDIVHQVGDIQSRLVSVNTTRTTSFVWGHHDTKGTPTSNEDMSVAKVSMETEVTESEVTGVQVKGAAADTGAVSEHIVTKIRMIEPMIVSGLVVIDQTLWVTHWGNPYVYAYTMTSPHKPQIISIEGLTNPIDMVRFPPGQTQLVISDNQAAQLRWIKLEQTNGVWKVRSQNSTQLRCPRGLGARDNQLLVFVSVELLMFSTSGEQTDSLYVWPRHAWKAVPRFKLPGFVIWDDMQHHIVVMNAKGDIQHTYQHKLGYLNGGMVCHGHSIYVTDPHNNRVDELNDDGRQVRQLISQQGVIQPTRLCLDEERRMYVAQGGIGGIEVWVIETTATPCDTQTASPGGRLLTQQTRIEMSVTWCD